MQSMNYFGDIYAKTDVTCLSLTHHGFDKIPYYARKMIAQQNESVL